MEVFNKRHETTEHRLEPVRGSLFLLSVKLALMMIIFDLLYAGIFYLGTLGIVVPFDLHQYVSGILFTIQIFKTFVATFLMVQLVIYWANNTYYFTGKHIIKRSGILNIKEEVYHYDNIRSIAINQSWLGKLFHYGDIYLKVSASGGYQDDVWLTGIENPHKYESMLKKLF